MTRVTVKGILLKELLECASPHYPTLALRAIAFKTNLGQKSCRQNLRTAMIKQKLDRGQHRKYLGCCNRTKRLCSTRWRQSARARQWNRIELLPERQVKYQQVGHIAYSSEVQAAPRMHAELKSWEQSVAMFREQSFCRHSSEDHGNLKMKNEA